MTEGRLGLVYIYQNKESLIVGITIVLHPWTIIPMMVRSHSLRMVLYADCCYEAEKAKSTNSVLFPE